DGRDRAAVAGMCQLRSVRGLRGTRRPVQRIGAAQIGACPLRGSGLVPCTPRMRRTNVKLGLAILRSTIGVLFMGHGMQKLAGWFGGHGLEGTGQFFESAL